VESEAESGTVQGVSRSIGSVSIRSMIGNGSAKFGARGAAGQTYTQSVGKQQSSGETCASRAGGSSGRQGSAGGAEGFYRRGIQRGWMEQWLSRLRWRAAILRRERPKRLLKNELGWDKLARRDAGSWAALTGHKMRRRRRRRPAMRSEEEAAAAPEQEKKNLGRCKVGLTVRTTTGSNHSQLVPDTP